MKNKLFRTGTCVLLCVLIALSGMQGMVAFAAGVPTAVGTEEKTTISSLQVSVEGFEFYDDDYLEDILGKSNVKLIVNGDIFDECHNDGTGTFVNDTFRIKAVDYQTEPVTRDDTDYLHVTLYFDETAYDWQVAPQADFYVEYWGSGYDPEIEHDGSVAFLKKPFVIDAQQAFHMEGAEVSVSINIPSLGITADRVLTFGNDFEKIDNEWGDAEAVYTFTGFEEGSYSVWVSDISDGAFRMNVTLITDDEESFLVDDALEWGAFSKDSFILISKEDDMIIGDVDENEMVDITDATMIQLIVAGATAPTLVQVKAADVNGDNKIDITDATMIQLFIAGMITEFPAAASDPLVLSEDIPIDFNVWEHLNETVILSDVAVWRAAGAGGAAVKLDTYLFDATSDEVDLEQLIYKKINAKATIVAVRTEIGVDDNRFSRSDEIELRLSDVEVLGDAEQLVSYIVADETFNGNFFVGQQYEIPSAQLASTDDVFDTLHYSAEGSVPCQYNYSVFSQYEFDYEKLMREYQGKQLHCMGVCRGTEEAPYIDITYIEVN